MRAAFYVSYLWHKLILPLEVRTPKFKLWWYELCYTLHKFRDYEYCLPWKYKQDVISTRFGSFRIRSGTADAANVSPAFERRDLNRLFALISNLTGAGKRVLFLDVGGDIGTYSVAVGKRFAGQQVHTLCFEPVPASCDLIRENVSGNQLSDRVDLVELALMDEKTDELKINLNVLAPGSSSLTGEGEELVVRADRLDHVLEERDLSYDVVVMKLDVEGAEESVLRGATGFLEEGVETHLMVEDFIDQSIIAYLESSGWDFRGKLTEYNSWWKKN